MKRLFQWVALLTCGLILAACEQDEPIKRRNEGSVKPLSFEMSSSLGAVAIRSLSSNTDKLNEDDLRASLFNKGSDDPAQTVLKASDFGENKREARWGVIYDGGKHYALNCKDAIENEPLNAISNNTVLFKNATKNTIEGAKLKMFCRSLTDLTDIKYGFMCLEGKAGLGDDKTKQYFKGETAPNHRLQGVATNASQAERHIPIMTSVVDFDAITEPIASTSVKFAPRGSLIGLHIRNRIATNIIVTDILVQREGALNYCGYFDWSQAGPASFHPEYTAEQLANTALSLPVYQNETTDQKGYTINKDNTEMPCFYVWGFQNPNKKGESFQVQIRYRVPGNDTEFTTKTFKIFAPNSVVDGVAKQFDDGYSYNTKITINDSNKTGGSTGLDWGNGGTLPNDGGGENPAPPRVYYRSLNFTTPLDFVSEMPAINKAGTGFVKNHNMPHTTTVADMNDDEVGYYDWNQAMALFTEKAWLKNNKYYLPTYDQWKSIVTGPHKVSVYFDKIRAKTTVLELAQVGETTASDYYSDYITVQEGVNFVTYALRFKDTDWVSAWRYSYEEEAGIKMMVIKCVPLRGRTGITLDNIKNPEFFTTNDCSIRTFPFYGYRSRNSSPSVDFWTYVSAYWSSTSESYENHAYKLCYYSDDAFLNDSEPLLCYPLRPFRKDPNATPAKPPRVYYRSLNFTTPLDFVSEMPAINKAGTGLVKNHDLPHTKVIADMNDDEAGYYNYDDAKALFNKPWLKNGNYYQPNFEQWKSIVSDGDNMVSFSINEVSKGKRTIRETAQVGETTAQEYTSDYVTVQEGDLYVTYALRFKDTDWVSAWRYSFEDEAGVKMMVIKCVPLKGRTAITLDNIKSPEFFTTNDCSIRTFPGYGCLEESGTSVDNSFGSNGGFWSSFDDDESGNLMAFLDSFACSNYDERTFGYSVCPFRKDPNATPAKPPRVYYRSLNFTTPLDFVSEMPTINKAGTGFVTNYDFPHTTVIADMNDDEAGYYDWERAKDLFNKPWLKNNNYYLPNEKQWRSIVPSKENPAVYFDNIHDKSTVLELAQVGETTTSDYYSDYITVQEGGFFVTYALRFKDTDWVSAWRYSYEREAGVNMMVIKCVPLKGRTAITLDNIKNPDFFTTNDCSIRSFPTYGFRYPDNSYTYFNSYFYYWSSDIAPPVFGSDNYAFAFSLDRKDSRMRSCSKLHGLLVCPFRRP